MYLYFLEIKKYEYEYELYRILKCNLLLNIFSSSLPVVHNVLAGYCFNTISF
jgi:hypothetical protein